jgi:collagenase-like PrtC family protease
MKIYYQIMNFDLEKALSVLDEVKVDAIIIGDMSCLKRNIAYWHNAIKVKEFWPEIPLYFQLPLISKEGEMETLKRFLSKQIPTDGYITGDLGVVSLLDPIVRKKKLHLIYTTNILNSEFSRYIKENFSVSQIRPLMYKRVFIEENVGFPKDIVVYGNLMLNCATFCFHSGDQIEDCLVACKKPEKMIMKQEKVFLIGRSFITENRLDLIHRLPNVKEATSATIQDFNLSISEIKDAIRRVKKV